MQGFFASFFWEEIFSTKRGFGDMERVRASATARIPGSVFIDPTGFP
jgi:hypothetical protein